MNRRNKLAKVIALVLAIAFAVMTFSTLLSVNAASTSQELAKALDKQEEIAMKMQDLEGKQDQLSQSKTQLSGDLAWLNQRSDEQKALYEEKSAQLTAALKEMDDAITAFADSEQVLADKKQQYNKRMQIMYEHKNKSMFSVFLESNSLHGFFTTLQLMSIIADTDEQMLEDLEIARDDAELKRELAQQKMKEMEQVVEQVQAELDRIEQDAAVTIDNLEQVNFEISEFQAAEEELNDLSKQLGSEIYSLQQKLAAEKSAAATKAAEATRAAEATKAAQAAQEAPAVEKPPANSPNSQGWVWPVPSSRNITSNYGNRMHPVYGYMRFHSGIDISAGYGQPIVSSRAGTVIIVRNPVEGRNWGGYGYGNYVVVDHGDGFATLYAHMKNTKVSVGQSVDAGQLVGTCGSTGTSTGSHLHFEVMKNGSTTNPRNYVG